jgi:hypothetical protein
LREIERGIFFVRVVIRDLEIDINY